MEISAATSPSRPLLLLLRPLASSSPVPPATSPTTATTTIRRRPSASATATVRRRARTRPHTRRSKPPSDVGGSLSGEDGDGGPLGPGGGGGGWWNGGSGAGAGWDSSEPDVPAPRRSAAEAAFGVFYELMCLIALSNCTQFAVRRLAGLLAARVAALRFVPTVC
ncbi:hypothetical protein GUJ93_ZPchr0001g33000 [Zizania palustris]|uniref:Uncharacterized protein n=1 Tax=Zizania palustris TaxID=103762 RepID=A0A8J5UZV3_ZIZPA|nr:hypothetical protein GUJ93_ZPchr0001g33000 [Zizania palustris]